MGKGTGTGVVVEQVRGAKDLRAFLRLPWRIYAGDPAWVPPLLSDQKAALDPARHPFHRHAETAYFLARHDGAVVGRIAAIVNHAHNEFHEDRTGFFGLFESADDASVAHALLERAEAWLRERGMATARGPVNLSTNEELFSPGILLEGFRRSPAVMMAHNPPYYRELIESAGYRKAMDLLSYWGDADVTPERLARGAALLASRYRVILRPIELKHFAREVAILKDIYNSAWERNWGFVPMTDAEFEHMARELRPVVEPKLALIAEIDGEPVGFGVGLPDFNQALKHVDGRLFPFGVVKLLWHKRKIDAMRMLTLGVKPAYRRMGIDAMIMARTMEHAQVMGMPRGECSWILEDNWPMRRALERMGATVIKTYRVYEKPLARPE